MTDEQTPGPGRGGASTPPPPIGDRTRAAAPEAPVSGAVDDVDRAQRHETSPTDAPPEALGGPADPDARPADPDARPADLETLSARAAERDEYLAMAQRTRADFENYRKRVTREAAGAEARATVRIVRELLPAIDNLGRALAAATQDAVATGEASRTLAAGMRLVQGELLSAFTRVGVESYEPIGEPFDPAFHEAIAQHHVPGAEPGTVVEVYQSGYRLDGSVIRPARVVVAGEPPAGAGDLRES